MAQHNVTMEKDTLVYPTRQIAKQWTCPFRYEQVADLAGGRPEAQLTSGQ